MLVLLLVFKNDFGSSAEFQLILFFWLLGILVNHTATDIYSKWPTESGLVGQGIVIESNGFLFKPHQALCQA